MGSKGIEDMFSTFAGIGLKMLIPALNLRRNTKEYRPVRKLDESASGCFSCPHYNTDAAACSSCEKKQYYTETETIYLNERNRYGYRKPLKKNALLLLMHLYFLNPDRNGLIRKIDPEEMAEALCCSVRTIVNNLHLLHDAGYILLARHEIPGYYQAFISEYQSSFDPAEKGGRGFVRLSRDFLKALTQLSDTNMIRLAVRSYIDNLQYEGRHSVQREKSIHEIKHLLPEYVTKKKLFSILSDDFFTKLFHVTTSKRSATIITLPEFDSSTVADLAKEDCRQKTLALLEQINHGARPGKGRRNGSSLHFSSRELTDIANIALRLPVDSILYGIRQFYEKYVIRNIVYQNAPSLIRTFAADHAQLGFSPG